MTNNDNIIDVSEATFETDVINRSHEKPVVVDFWAPWCGPCRALGPLLERLAADPTYDFVLAKINVDENPNISMRFRVQGIPAVKAFVDGEVVAEFTGALPEPRVRQFLEKLVPSEVDQALERAAALLALHHWAEAETTLAPLLDDNPTHGRASYLMAKALLGQARGCEALPYLRRVKDGPELLSSQRLMTLATYLCRIETAIGDEDLPPLEMQYNRSAQLIERGNLEAAMDGLLDVLRQDKRYRGGEAKDVMLAIFELLGDTDTMTLNYRQELASVLF